MVFHPRDRSPWNRRVTRRDMLRYTAGGAVTAYLLAACGGGGQTTASGDSGILIGTPQDPVRQPIPDDSSPIESNLEPESGPLRIYNWADYIWPRVLKDFTEQTGAEVELTTFYNLEEATRKLRTGEVKFDVFFPTAEIVPKFVAGELLQPLNHDYLPNLKKNIWPRLSDPYYDLGSRYTVPYVIYTTGIGWRADMIEDDIAALDNPWEALWNPDYKNLVGFYDDYRETIAVGMYKSGITEVNGADPEHLETAKDNLIEAAEAVNARYTIDGAYARMPEGIFGIHHAWAGDIVGARYYFPQGDDPSVLRYVWPPDGNFNGGLVSNDALAILKNAESPVLAHMFLNFMLDDKYSKKNFGWLGYQPPLTSLDPDTLIRDGWVPEYVSSAVITEEKFKRGQVPNQLDAKEDAAWLKTWSEIQAGG